ncbi:MAG: hypothetical protein L0241_11850 [Planctomycetia bacterium]|nr:hypothetical protein [Planctomycetia bacterium]
MNASRYTVRRLGWHQPPHGDPYTRRVPTAEPIATFDTFDEAELHRREREAECRADENPFRFGGGSVFFQSSLDGPRLHDWLMDAGIDPPVSHLHHRDWRAWWDAFAHTWSADQLAHAWAAFDKVKFFDVAEEVPNVAHVVIDIVWGRLQRDGGTVTAGTEGGRLVGVYRRAGSAEAERMRQNRVRNNGHNFHNSYWFRYDRRRGYDESSRTWPLPRATFFEVVQVPTNVPPLAGVGFLVQRRAIGDTASSGWRERPSRDARVPLWMFAERSAAEAFRDQLAVECRQTVNPFVFVEPDAEPFYHHKFTRLALPLPLPASDRRLEWVEWWDLCQDEATEDQRAAVWEVCDQPLFEVLRVEVSDA